MKSLNEINNRDSGKLLADLFPDMKESIVDAIEIQCAYTIEHEKEIRAKWKNGFVPFDFWLSLAMELGDVIRKHRHSLYKSNAVFADQLFYEMRAVFANDAVVKYAKKSDSSTKFSIAVALLFCSEHQFEFHFKIDQ